MTRAERVRRSDPNSHFLTHCAVMPGWHKLVVIAAFLLAIAGLTGVMIARSGGDAHLQFSSKNNDAAAGADKHAPAAEPPVHVGSLSRAAMPAMVVGVSVLAGFVGGWFLRAYLVQGMCLVILAVAGLWGLSHFGVLHLGDGSSGPAAWLLACGIHVKSAALAHLPSAGSGVLAALLGFRRW